MALRWAIIILLTYLAVCVLASFLQTYLIYFPSHDYHATPVDVGLSFEALTLATADGVSIMDQRDSTPNSSRLAASCTT